MGLFKRKDSSADGAQSQTAPPDKGQDKEPKKGWLDKPPLGRHASLRSCVRRMY